MCSSGPSVQDLRADLHRISLTPSLMPSFASACLLFIEKPGSILPVATCIKSLMTPAEVTLKPADVIAACETVFAKLNDLAVDSPKLPSFIGKVH